MRTQPHFLFIILCSLLLHHILAECCVKFNNQKCIQCPSRMHLYRHNCIYDLPHCLTYNAGFDCASCQQNFQLDNKTNTCQSITIIDYSDFMNSSFSIPSSGWHELVDQEYQSSDVVQLNYMSQDKVLDKASDIALHTAYKNSVKNQTFYRMIFTFSKGYLEHVYLKNTPINDSSLVLAKFITRKISEQRVDITQDQNLTICNNFLIQSNKNLSLKNSLTIGAFSEKRDNESIFYRIVYTDADHGLRNFSISLQQAIDFSKGVKRQILNAKDLNLTFSNELISQLGEVQLKYVDPSELKNATITTFLNDSSITQFNLTFQHSDIVVNETEQPPISYINFIVRENQVQILSEYLFKRQNILLNEQVILELKVSCSRKSSIRALQNTTSIVLEAYAKLPTQESLKNAMLSITKCIINPIKRSKFTILDYLSNSNETTDIYKVTSIIMEENFTLIYATLSIDKRSNEITLMELLSVPHDKYLVESFYVENNTKLQKILSNDSNKFLNKVYEEHLFQQAEVLSVSRLVEFRKIEFATEQGQFNQFVFKYTIKRPIAKKVIINGEISIEGNVKLNNINKDLNQYEFVEFTYRVSKDNDRGITRMPITLYLPERWRKTSTFELSAINVTNIDKQMGYEPLYQNAIVNSGLVNLDSPLKKRVVISVIYRYIFNNQLVYQLDLDQFFPPKLISNTIKRKQTADCSPYPNCSAQVVQKGLISISDIQKNLTLSGIMQFIKDQFAPQIEDKNFTFLKKLQSSNMTPDEGVEFQAMYTNSTNLTNLSAFLVRLALGKQIISVNIVDQQNVTQVGRTLLYTCYKFYNTTETIPESALSIAKRTLQTKVRAFQKISQKQIDAPQLQVQVTNDTILSIVDTKVNKNYTFGSSFNTIPLIWPIGVEKLAKFDNFDNFITIRTLLEEILGVDRIGKVFTETQEVLYDFNVIKRTNYFSSFDQILVSFYRGVIQRNNVKQIINKTSTEAQYFTFEIPTPQKAGQTLIPRVFLSNNYQMMISMLSLQGKLDESQIQTEPVRKFIQKLYRDAYIIRQRNLRNSTVWMILISHRKFGRMNILADIADQVIYQIDFEMYGMSGIVKSGTSYQELAQENLKEAEQLSSVQLSRIMQSTDAYRSDLAESSRRLILLEWRMINLNAIKRVFFTYQNQKYVVQTDILYNTSSVQRNKAINMFYFRADPNTKEGLKDQIRDQRIYQLNKILKSEDWTEAEKSFKKTQGYYVAGGKVVDIRMEVGVDRIYYTARYQVRQNILEVQLLYNPSQKRVTTLSIVPRFQATPFILPANCEQGSSKGGDCSKCKSDFSLHRDLTCYKKILRCQAQSGIICIRCTSGYILLDKKHCF